jgi:hypothetical protein
MRQTVRWSAQLVAISVAVIAIVAWAPRIGGSNSGTANGALLADESCLGLFSSSAIAGAVIAAYATMAGGPRSISDLPSPSIVSAQARGIFSSLCENSAFDALGASLGARNITLDLYGNSATGIAYANYSFIWTSWHGGAAYANELSWSGRLSTGSISGPIAQSGDVGPTSGSDYTLYNSYTWAGWEFWLGSNTLTGESGDPQVIPMEEPASGTQENVPSGVIIDPVGAVWDGLTTVHGGSSTSLDQTGYSYDVADPSGSYCISGQYTGACDYGLWWEFLPTLPYPYSGNPHLGAGLSVGDELDETVLSNVAGFYNNAIDDYTSGNIWTNTLYTDSWAPTFAEYVIEAFGSQTNGHIQQIINFPTLPVNFEDAALCDPGCSQSSFPYDIGDCNIWQLNQESGDSNTNQNFVSGTNYWGDTASWPQVSHENSRYNYNYV